MAEEKDYQDFADSLDRFLTDHNPRHLVLGTGYGAEEIDNLRALASVEVQAVLSKHGFHDIALEARQQFQSQADQVANGNLTPEDLARRVVNTHEAVGDDQAAETAPLYEARGELVARSAGRGIMVHFVENQHPGLTDALNVRNRVDSLKSLAAEYTERAYHDTMDEAELTEYFQDLARLEQAEAAGQEAVAEDIYREVLAERTQAGNESPIVQNALRGAQNMRIPYDPELAQSILEATEGRKTVVMYGSDHGATSTQDLDEQLGPDTARIRLVRDRSAYYRESQIEYQSGREAPEAYLTVEEGYMVPGDEAYRAAEDYDPVRKDNISDPAEPVANTPAPAQALLS